MTGEASAKFGTKPAKAAAKSASAAKPVPAAARASLDFTPALQREMAPVFERVKHVITPMEWVHYAPLINAINELKVKRDAVILAHNYMTPEIFHCVSDFKGDSLQLAKEAARSKAKVIVQAGVHFMAETSKLLSPDKTVLIPDLRAGCSLAASITAADVRLLREAYPGVPVVTYVNTSAAVKAECDITCTSSNAVKVVESLNAPRVLLIPDEYLSKYVQTKTKVEIIAWRGHCEVHERFTGEELAAYRLSEPGVKIIAHPECPPDVIASYRDGVLLDSDYQAWLAAHGQKDSREGRGAIVERLLVVRELASRAERQGLDREAPVLADLATARQARLMQSYGRELERAGSTAMR